MQLVERLRWTARASSTASAHLPTSFGRLPRRGGIFFFSIVHQRARLSNGLALFVRAVDGSFAPTGRDDAPSALLLLGAVSSLSAHVFLF